MRTKGVAPPEVAVEPAAFFGLLAQMMGATGQPIPVRVSRIPEGGTPESVPVEGLLSLVMSA
jgi:hypothetical protein